MTTDMLARLFDNNLRALPPTTTRFFVPNEGFWTAMSAYKDLLVFELGAGNGDLVREAKARGFKWGGCDLNASYEQAIDPGIHCINAMRFPYTPGVAALACRPDHSGWVKPSLQAALCGGSNTIYVSKQRNISNDLGSFARSAVAKIKNVGEDDEVMLLFSPKGKK